jgi:exonuclease III
MENTSSENDQVVMMGDFNVDQKNIKMIEWRKSW